jgi:hypothetical protein
MPKAFCVYHAFVDIGEPGLCGVFEKLSPPGPSHSNATHGIHEPLWLRADGKGGRTQTSAEAPPVS